MMQGEHIGHMDRWITFEKNTPATDPDYNTKSPSWAELFSCFSEKQQKSGRQGFEAHQQVATTVETFRVRYDSRVGPNNRINDHGEIYNIKVVETIGRNNYLLVTAEKAE